ncbi:Sugar transferase [Desulfarculales bacterium]
MPSFLRPLPLPWLKRGFDLAFAIILNTLSAPVFLLASAGIFLEKPAPGTVGGFAFLHRGAGAPGSSFRLRKFNIFKPGVIEGVQQRGQFAHTKDLRQNDRSLSIAGTMLQRAYLDELPQLFSILAGDTTVVGPWPRNLEIYKQGLAKGDFFRGVLKAGQTSMVQSQKDLPGLTMDKQASMDQEELEFQQNHRSWQLFLLDLSLICRTVVLMAKAKRL